jgi:hypothetical protein
MSARGREITSWYRLKVFRVFKKKRLYLLEEASDECAREGDYLLVSPVRYWYSSDRLSLLTGTWDLLLVVLVQ